VSGLGKKSPARETGKLRDSDEVLGVIVALIISGVAAVFAALLGGATGMFLGGLLFRIGLTTAEGAAWSGISLGIPIGLVFAIVAFVYCFPKFRASGQPDLPAPRRDAGVVTYIQPSHSRKGDWLAGRFGSSHDGTRVLRRPTSGYRSF
jgi:hypothetical protein